MKGRITLLIIFLFIFSSLISATPMIEQDSLSLSNLRGTTQLTLVDGNFDVKNTGSATISVEISGLILKTVNNDTIKLNLIGTTTDFQLIPDGSKRIRFRADTSTAVAGTYTGNIFLTDQNGNTDSIPTTLHITKNFDYNLKPIKKELVMNFENQFQIEVTNNGNINEEIEFKLNALTNRDGFFPLNSNIITKQITMGEKETLTFNTNLPDGIISGSYDLEVSLTSTSSDYSNVININRVNVREQIPSLKLTPSDIEAIISIDKRSFTFEFDLINDGEKTINNIEVNLFDSDDDFTYTNVPSLFSLDAGKNKTITIAANSLREIKDGNLADLKVSADGISRISKIVRTAKTNKLTIEKVQLEIGADRDTLRRTGDRFDDDIKPGSGITGEIKICNEYESRTKIDIDNIDVNILIEDIDDGRDFVDDTKRDFNLEAGDCITKDLVFEDDYLPFEIREDVYVLLITIDGTDDLGYFQEQNFTIELDVEKKRDDILVQKFYSTPKDVDTCFDTQTISISSKLYNIGTDDQENIKVDLISDELNYRDSVNSFDLDSDNNNHRILNFNYVMTSDVKAGKYNFRLDVYLDYQFGQAPDVIEDFVLEVSECSGNSFEAIYEDNLKLLDKLNNNDNSLKVIESENKPLIENLDGSSIDDIEESGDDTFYLKLMISLITVFILAIALIILLFV